MAILLSSHLLNQVQSRVRPDRHLRRRPADRAGDDGRSWPPGSARATQTSRSGSTCTTAPTRPTRAGRSCGAVRGVASVDDGAAARRPVDVTSRPARIRGASRVGDPGRRRGRASCRWRRSGPVVPSLEDIYRRAVGRPARRHERACGHGRTRRCGRPPRRRASVDRSATRRRSSRSSSQHARDRRARDAPSVPAAAAERWPPRSPRRAPSRARLDDRRGKEFGDHLLSARFVVLVIVLGLAAAIPLYFAAAHDPRCRLGRDRTPRRSSSRCSGSPPTVGDQSRCRRSPGSWPTSRRCSGWRSRSTRSTASAPRARCRASCPSRSIATTSSTASSWRASRSSRSSLVTSSA